mmetsp:Transcript_21963/g.67874  ORF Transcript_21963/g.67874 Transcript_21963/m.67874 type:complete len:296 (+) Transcript_21963:1797-2684(+)
MVSTRRCVWWASRLTVPPRSRAACCCAANSVAHRSGIDTTGGGFAASSPGFAANSPAHALLGALESGAWACMYSPAHAPPALPPLRLAADDSPKAASMRAATTSCPVCRSMPGDVSIPRLASRLCTRASAAPAPVPVCTWRPMIVARSRMRCCSRGASGGAGLASSVGAAHGIRKLCRCGRSAAARSGGTATKTSEDGVGAEPLDARSAKAASKDASTGPGTPGSLVPSACNAGGDSAPGRIGSALPCRNATARGSSAASPTGRNSAGTPALAPGDPISEAAERRDTPGRPRMRS